MNINARPALLLVLAGFGCVPDFGTGNADLTILGVAAPASSTAAVCLFDADTSTLLGDAVVLDLAASDTLNLPLVVRNDSDEPVSVASLDMRWECIAQGFTPALGSLIVPTYDATRSFCRDLRLTQGDFVGFDTIPATGAPIQPGETSIVWIEVVPSQLGQGFVETIEIGALASDCLDDNPLGLELVGPNCAAFDDRMKRAGDQDALRPETVRRFAGFAQMDGHHELDMMAMPSPTSSGYRMQIRGQLSDNDDIFSNEVVHAVDVCQNCGALTNTTPPSRDPRTGYECYYESPVAR